MLLDVVQAQQEFRDFVQVELAGIVRRKIVGVRNLDLSGGEEVRIVEVTVIDRDTIEAAKVFRSRHLFARDE